MSVIFYLMVIIVFYFDYKLWRKVTPNIISFFGITVISIFYDMFGGQLGFIEVNFEVYIYLMFFLLFGFLGSLVAFFILRVVGFNVRGQVLDFNIRSGGKGNIAFFMAFIILVSFISYSILNVYRLTATLTGDEFESYLTYGILGHAYTLLLATIPFLFLKYRSRAGVLNVYIYFIFAAIFLLFLKQVKYWVIVPFIWIFIIKIYLDSNSIAVGVFKFSFYCGLFSLFSFVMVYFYKIAYHSDGISEIEFFSVLLDIANHLFAYLFSGLLVFSELIGDGVFNEHMVRDPLVLFRGATNIFRAVLGLGVYEEEGFLIDFYTINTVTMKTGNVGTLWASFLLYLGYFSFLFFFTIIFLLSLFLGLSTRYNLAFLLYTCISAFIFLSWFASYFELISPYETSSLVIFIYIFSYGIRNNLNFSNKVES